MSFGRPFHAGQQPVLIYNLQTIITVTAGQMLYICHQYWHALTHTHAFGGKISTNMILLLYMCRSSNSQRQIFKTRDREGVVEGLGNQAHEYAILLCVHVCVCVCSQGLDGEILITARTDPGWVPLYPLCSGLAIERGRLESIVDHSATCLSSLLAITCACLSQEHAPIQLRCSVLKHSCIMSFLGHTSGSHSVPVNNQLFATLLFPCCFFFQFVVSFGCCCT